MGTALKRIIIALLALGILAIPISIPRIVVAKDDYLTYDQLKAYEEKRQEQEWSNQLVAYSQTLIGKKTGSCVQSLRRYFGISADEVQGAAKSTKTNTQTAKVGAVIVFKNMSKWGHVGIVIKVDGAIITYFDSNGQWTNRGAIRTIINNDRRISGYRITK